MIHVWFIGILIAGSYFFGSLWPGSTEQIPDYFGSNDEHPSIHICIACSSLFMLDDQYPKSPPELFSLVKVSFDLDKRAEDDKIYSAKILAAIKAKTNKDFLI
ncbi:hypothetical protein FDECE_13235 [Fusarium decemcellulare]|nr:hypothetical protein FDECE_13235 [Fusarium decemcellulare]